MNNLTVQLTGYFDNNFGDDYMMKIIVHSLPEIDFVIDENEIVNPLILEEDNIKTEKITNKSQYPKLIVTGCGFMINSKAALFTELIYFLKQKHVGDYCLGCNIEPLDNCLKRLLIIRKLNKFKLIVCRDKKSLSWLCKFVDKPKKEHLPDILFGLPDEWLPRMKSDNNLGISLMHRKGDAEDCRYYKDMADIADFWVEKTGHGVCLMAFNSGSEDDVYSCECVKKLMKNPEMVEIAAHKGGGEIFDAYSKCSKIIGARFHSAVLALKIGLPFFPVVYREKMKNIIDDLEYPVYGCKIDEIDSKSIKDFLINDVSYKINESIVSASSRCSTVLREALDKEWEIR